MYSVVKAKLCHTDAKQLQRINKFPINNSLVGIFLFNMESTIYYYNSNQEKTF